MDFHATIKLITGEELFGIVFSYEENDKQFLLIYEPIIFTEFKSLNGNTGYKIEPWLKTADDDLFIIEKSRVITLSESRNKNMINYHLKYVKQKNSDEEYNPYKETLTKEQGYIDNTKEIRSKLERLLEQ